MKNQKQSAATIFMIVIVFTCMISSVFGQTQAEFDSLFSKQKSVVNGMAGSLDEKNKILKKDAERLLEEKKKAEHERAQKELEEKDFAIQYELQKSKQRKLERDSKFLLDAIDTLAFDVELLSQGINSVITTGTSKKVELDQKIKQQSKDFVSISKIIVEKVLKVHPTPQATPGDSTDLQQQLAVVSFSSPEYNKMLTDLKVSNKLLEDHIVFLTGLKAGMQGQVTDLQNFVDNQLAHYQSYFVSLKAQIKSGGKIKRPTSK
ncbi:MAG TPA: hypothetical protein PKC14_03595 [Candidatus Absconditabacterales bacterium]|nr:hypothetical protein [Candidatus Absconditabacterales bacterium]